MGKLVYAMITSLDGFVADEDGNFDWAEPDAELHAYVNDLERPIGTALYGRRMYDIMKFWETALEDPDESPIMRDYAEVWQATDKVVYSRTLDAVSSGRTRIERSFDPDAVRALKSASGADISIGGPELAAEALRAGLVDEIHLFAHPVVLGRGNPSLPADVRLELELLDHRRFASGVVHLHYRVLG